MTVDEQADFYFAYGSNMNPKRVLQRKMQFGAHCGGVLHGYRLAFNKRSAKIPGAASANVQPSAGGSVEGVLYALADAAQIEIMDVFEGYPVLYRRERLPIRLIDRVATAWVYIANSEFVVEGLKPAHWYLAHLLAGSDYLSPAYYKALKQTVCLPDSAIEPS